LNEQFRAGLAEVLLIEAPELSASTPLTEETWDSMAIISTIALIDSTFGITVPISDLRACGTVGELIAVIDKTLSAGSGSGL
jgi:acyl carrier protein